MLQPQRQEDLAARTERRRQALQARPDVSDRLRELSQSGSRHPIGPQPQRRSMLAVFAAIGAVVALVACVATATLVIASSLWFQNQLGDATATTQDFYSALQQQSYDRAFGYLSPAAQGRTTRSAFADQFSSTDSVSGAILSYSVVSSVTSGSSAKVVVDVVRRGNTAQAQRQTLTMTKINDAWRIETIVSNGTVTVASPTP